MPHFQGCRIRSKFVVIAAEKSIRIQVMRCSARRSTFPTASPRTRCFPVLTDLNQAVGCRFSQCASCPRTQRTVVPNHAHNSHMRDCRVPWSIRFCKGDTEEEVRNHHSLSSNQIAPRRKRPGAECPLKRMHTTLRTPPSPAITMLRRFSSDPRAHRRYRCGHTTPLRAMPDSDRPAYRNSPQGDTTTHPISNCSTLAAASS